MIYIDTIASLISIIIGVAVASQIAMRLSGFDDIDWSVVREHIFKLFVLKPKDIIILRILLMALFDIILMVLVPTSLINFWLETHFKDTTFFVSLAPSIVVVLGIFAALRLMVACGEVVGYKPLSSIRLLGVALAFRYISVYYPSLTNNLFGIVACALAFCLGFFVYREWPDSKFSHWLVARFEKKQKHDNSYNG